MTTTIIILLSSAVVLLVLLIAVLVWRNIRQSDELRQKNDVIVREVRRRAVRDLSPWQRALMPRPRGVAEFTKTVAEFTKSSLAGKKSLQVSKIFIIFATILLHTNDINTI